MRVGVISDTHGWLPPAVHDAFAGASAILHAGDVGSLAVLDELETIAPVTAVRGNMDASDLDGALVVLANVALGGTRVLVVHRSRDVPRPLPTGVGVVVTGHTHAATVERNADGVLRLNPGSASRSDRRSVAVLEISEGEASAEIVVLD